MYDQDRDNIVPGGTCLCGRTSGDCEHCKTYICAKCERVCIWEFGCGDDFFPLCDDCWGVAQDRKAKGTNIPAEWRSAT